MRILFSLGAVIAISLGAAVACAPDGEPETEAAEAPLGTGHFPLDAGTDGADAGPEGGTRNGDPVGGTGGGGDPTG